MSKGPDDSVGPVVLPEERVIYGSELPVCFLPAEDGEEI